MRTINKPIFRVAVKNNWRVAAIVLGVAVLFMALTRIIYAFMGFPEFLDTGTEKGYWLMMGLAGMFSTGGNFSIMVLILLVIVGGGFIHRPALDTSLAAYLTVPVSRKSYAVTTLLAYYALITAWVIAAALLGLVTACTALGEIEIQWLFVRNYFATAGVFLLLSLTISAISYFAATLFAGTRVRGMYVLMPIAFFVLSMFVGIAEGVKPLAFIRYLTPYGWFNTNYVFDKGMDADLLTKIENAFWGEGGAPEYNYNWWDRNQWLPALLCLAIIAVCSIASVVIYRKKKFAI